MDSPLNFRMSDPKVLIAHHINIYSSFSALCPAISFENGEVNYDMCPVNEAYTVGTVASFMCNQKYRLSASIKRTCQSPNTWTEETPKCIMGNELNTLYSIMLAITL